MPPKALIEASPNYDEFHQQVASHLLGEAGTQDIDGALPDQLAVREALADRTYDAIGRAAMKTSAQGTEQVGHKYAPVVTEVLGMTPSEANHEIHALRESYEGKASPLNYLQVAHRALFAVHTDLMYDHYQEDEWLIADRMQAEAEPPVGTPEHAAKLLDKLQQRELLIKTHYLEEDPMADNELDAASEAERKLHLAQRQVDWKLKRAIETEVVIPEEDKEVIVEAIEKMAVSEVPAVRREANNYPEELLDATKEFVEHYSDDVASHHALAA